MTASTRPLAAVALATAWVGCLLTAAPPVLAQEISVTTPRLPPRSPGPAPAQSQTQVQPGSPGGAQPGRPAVAQSGMQTGMQTGTQQGMQQGMQQGGYGGSPTQSGAYTNPAAQGPAYGGYGAYAAAPPPVAPVIPQRAEAGACRAQPTPDRQTLMLVSGAAALARGHVPLGEFRAQQVVHSPDGRWAVAYTKLRGAAQFAAVTIDLERCEVQRVLDLSAAGEDVRFDGDDAVLRLANGERRIGLRDGRVR